MPEIPASHRDLLDGEFATLATIGPDGRPQLSEVWFLAEGGTVALSLNTTRQKIKNLRANPAANVFLLDLALNGERLLSHVGMLSLAPGMRARRAVPISALLAFLGPVKLCLLAYVFRLRFAH